MKLNEKQWAALTTLHTLSVQNRGCRSPKEIGAKWQTLQVLVQAGYANCTATTPMMYWITPAGSAALAARGGGSGDVR